MSSEDRFAELFSHPFRGRLDRDCLTCGLPDRHAVHRTEVLDGLLEDEELDRARVAAWDGREAGDGAVVGCVLLVAMFLLGAVFGAILLAPAVRLVLAG